MEEINKKIGCLCVLMCMGAGVQAHGLDGHKGRFYAGGSVLYSRSFPKSYGVSFHDQVNDSRGLEEASLTQKDGYGIGVLGGYQKSLNADYFWGVEGVAQLQKMSLKNDDIDDAQTGGRISLTLKKKETFALLGQVGRYVRDRTAIFAQMGAVNTKFEARFDGQVQDGSDLSFAKTKRVWGGRMGLGLLSELSDKMLVKMEYAYTRYKKIRLEGAVYDGLASSVSSGFSPGMRDHSVIISFARRF